jgi:hypothetical protein
MKFIYNMYLYFLFKYKIKKKINISTNNFFINNLYDYPKIYS